MIAGRSEQGTKVVPEGTGTPVAIGVQMSIIGHALWTDGAYNVVDQLLPPLRIVPPHRHDLEAQACWVVSGRVGFWVDGEPEVELVAGGYISRPAGVGHSFWNPTQQPARLLEVTTPAASFERYLEAADELVTSGGNGADLAALGASYGITFLPEKLAELCEAHGVRVSTSFSDQ